MFLPRRTYDELYEDLYEEAKPVAQAATPPPQAAPAPAVAVAAAPPSVPSQAAPAPPSVYDTNPAQQQPAPLHFDANYSQRAADSGRSTMRPSDMPEEG